MRWILLLLSLPAFAQFTPPEGVGGAQVYPGAGIANSTGSAWGTSYTTSGSGTVVALTTSPTFMTPALGTPSALVLTNATGLPNASVIGLGTSATINTGTSGATIPLLSTANTWTTTQTLPSPVITNIAPGADFTVTQNSVAPFTIVSSGAVVNTMYLTGGHTLHNTTTDLGAMLTVEDTRSTSPRGLLSLQNSTDTNGARVGFAKSRGTAGSPLTVVTGDTLGRSMYRGYDGTNYLEMASIEAVATGTIAATRVPTYMAFSTATDAAPSVLTERMRIFSSGGVSIGNTTDPGAGNLSVTGTIASAALTSGRIPFASTGGLLVDSSVFTFASTTLTLNGGMIVSRNATPLVILNSAGANYGHLSNLSSTSWGLGFGPSPTALGTSIITWNGGGSVGIGPANTSPTGTLDVTDKTATTGATRLNIGLGAADSTTTNIFTIAGTQKFAGNNTTAAVAGVIGATCPAVTCTAAYTWVQAVSSDGSTVYFPVWK